MNTEQFDGHTPGPWELYTLGENEQYHAIHRPRGLVRLINVADARLIRAAPELLAEVKRLEEQLVAYMDFLNWVAEEHNDVWDEYEGKDEL